MWKKTEKKIWTSVTSSAMQLESEAKHTFKRKNNKMECFTKLAVGCPFLESSLTKTEINSEVLRTVLG